MRDMLSRNDRSIRNIPVPANHRRALPPQEEYEDEIDDTTRPPKRQGGRRGRRWFMWGAIIIVALCALAGLLLSTFFAGATITVTPRTAAITAPATISAAVAPSAGGLAYAIVSTSRTASVQVQASGTQNVSLAASGVITIYNAYSSASQRLISNTRFEAPDGKIYRIHDSVVVPGDTSNADGTINPGTNTITAYADSPGADYNLGSTKFTIPGFQGDPRYDKFYAQADAMSGGFVGQQAAIAPADLSSAENSLKSGLASAINDAVATQIPKEFLAVPGTLAIVFDDVTQSPIQSGSVTLSQTATATADIIRTNDLAAAVAGQTVQGYTGEAVGFADPSKITLALASSTQPTGVIQLALSGSPTLVWQFDSNALKQALLGKDKGSFETIIQSFAPAIVCTKDTPCSASIRPFWAGTFPKDVNKIKVVVGQ